MPEQKGQESAVNTEEHGPGGTLSMKTSGYSPSATRRTRRLASTLDDVNSYTLERGIENCPSEIGVALSVRHMDRVHFVERRFH